MDICNVLDWLVFCEQSRASWQLPSWDGVPCTNDAGVNTAITIQTSWLSNLYCYLRGRYLARGVTATSQSKRGVVLSSRRNWAGNWSNYTLGYLNDGTWVYPHEASLNYEGEGERHFCINIFLCGICIFFFFFFWSLVGWTNLWWNVKISTVRVDTILLKFNPSHPGSRLTSTEAW